MGEKSSRFGQPFFLEVEFFRYFAVCQLFAVAIGVYNFIKVAAGVVVADGAVVDGVVKHFCDDGSIWVWEGLDSWPGHPWRWLGRRCFRSRSQRDHPWRLFMGVENIAQFVNDFLSLFAI